jgi:16S rRNA (uracil1498-N3)-methyltransferase
MSRRRFYVPRDCIDGSIALLSPDQSHHLRNVLRLKAGDAVEVFDGEGSAYAGVVDGFGDQARIASLKRLESSTDSGRTMILVQALLKSDKFDWVLQKATELGVRQIMPVETRFCNVTLKENKVRSRLERWNRITLEASKQCGRATVPQVHDPLPFTELVQHFVTCSSAKFLFCEKASLPWDATIQVQDDAVLCIGPEGGWDPSEVRDAARAGFRAFNLGPRILRAETAAIAALVLVQFQTGNNSVSETL